MSGVADADRWGRWGCRPAELVAECGGGGEGGGLHDFEVLLVLRGGAGGDLVEPLGGVGLIDAAEAVEGGEELVVAADAGGGDETAHGEGVDEGVVELLIVEGIGGGTPGRRRRSGCGGMLRVVAVGLKKLRVAGSTQRLVGGGIGDEGLGIDGAGEMHVEVRALGHAAEEGVELVRRLFLRR